LHRNGGPTVAAARQRFEVDGRYFCSRGQVRTDNSDNNVLEPYATDGLEDFRGDKFVATYRLSP
jgi:hypothetical protein